VPRVIPIPSEIRPHEVTRALRDCSQAIQNGDVVCIFAEGGITRDGQLQPFRRGFEHMMKGAVADTKHHPAAVIVPSAIIGLWGSIFSFAGGKIWGKWPGPFPRFTTVRFGKPLPPAATAEEVHAAVERLIK